MGSALALNMADNGSRVAVANRDAQVVSDFVEEAGPLASQIVPCEGLESFVDALAVPRVILFMIPSGDPMDAMIDAVRPLLAPGDTIIDGGNADFHLTRRRQKALEQHDLHFVGMGVSGGEEGARHGPSIMVGGSEHSWQQLRPVVEKIAARYEGDPCVDRMGPDGAGHFVKTVHNGIEYADMQMIAELVGLMRHGMGMAPDAIGAVFDEWNNGPLQSYLVEITGKLLPWADPATGQPMIDVILDSAGQKGTGRWTVIEAVKMGQSATMIEGAVAARAWSSEKALRETAADALGEDRGALDLSVDTLAKAFHAARLLDYAQGFRILAAASAEYDWGLDYARIAEIWRAGCIIRAAMLDDIAGAFHDGIGGDRLFLSPRFADILRDGIPALRQVVSQAALDGHAIPALASGLAFYDTMRQSTGMAGVIQAQRDFFGHHGFRRKDRDGDHHGPWW